MRAILLAGKLTWDNRDPHSGGDASIVPPSPGGRPSSGSAYGAHQCRHRQHASAARDETARYPNRRDGGRRGSSVGDASAAGRRLPSPAPRAHRATCCWMLQATSAQKEMCPRDQRERCPILAANTAIKGDTPSPFGQGTAYRHRPQVSADGPPPLQAQAARFRRLRLRAQVARFRRLRPPSYHLTGLLTDRLPRRPLRR